MAAITGTAARNTLNGTAGDDIITGGAGDDLLTGGAGKDNFAFKTGHGPDTITDFKLGTDKLSFTTRAGYQPWVQEATVGGVAGTKVIYDWNATDYVFLPGLKGVKAEWLLDPAKAPASVTSAVKLTGTSGADQLAGGAGHDTISGGAGGDVLSGAGGNDIIIGSRGADQMSGEAGADLFKFISGDGADTITDFQVGTDKLDFGTSAFAPTAKEAIVGGVEGTVVSYSANAGDSLFLAGVKGATIEQLINATGKTVAGTGRADVLTGGAGADVITGAKGADKMTGGAGADQFKFVTGDGTDSITDFQVGTDKLAFTTRDGYQPWVQAKTVGGVEGTLVRYDWNDTDSVFLPGVKGVAVDKLLNPGSSATPPQTPPATDPAPTTPPADGGGEFGSLIFSDDFNGLDRAKWTNLYDGATYWNGAFAWESDLVKVSDGQLHVGMQNAGNGFWKAGAAATSTGGGSGFAFEYGKVEIVAKVSQEITGAGPCFLLWPEDTTRWPPEIDILETPKGQGMFTNHWQGPGGNGDDEYNATHFDLDSSQWHTYTLEWTPDHLSLHVDGKLIKNLTDHIPSERMTLAIQGHVGTANDGWYGSPNGSGVNYVDIAVDSVKVWDWVG
jgi:beta-glucanase (GH16 family)